MKTLTKAQGPENDTNILPHTLYTTKVQATAERRHR
eukprot:CAMPEP_0174384510 /NCGR_PEP_ID=MMETSP0811_2-20130205/125969_1 /TAXON_ID=73025 ORGANISM="Eutreptiella gymnastica-like, Strain CCMP1594" /NCGR_SAMPLE_ID=MMETSP0811_2 /ASSEMBLY_ACC=CAM_ASM_000667 /LENGTH=35 /DNA_ID= /DNA_START= /DNA_END= /DNA_ORIENTATION=